MLTETYQQYIPNSYLKEQALLFIHKPSVFPPSVICYRWSRRNILNRHRNGTGRNSTTSGQIPFHKLLIIVCPTITISQLMDTIIDCFPTRSVKTISFRITYTHNTSFCRTISPIPISSTSFKHSYLFTIIPRISNELIPKHT